MDTHAFAGKVALVTGGTAGIGKAAAHLFARAGGNVVIAGRRLDKGRQAEQELHAAGGRVIYVQTDVSQPDQVQACIKKTVELFGRLDYAFNNAAALSKPGRTGKFYGRRLRPRNQHQSKKHLAVYEGPSSNRWKVRRRQEGQS